MEFICRRPENNKETFVLSVREDNYITSGAVIYTPWLN